MTLTEIKNHLKASETIAFQLPDGSLVPAHFHVTEVGRVIKDFIDCGGKRRKEEVANFQLWEENDYDHRLHPEKLIHIIELSQRTLDMGDLPIEVEYQGSTIGKYSLDFDGKNFLLMNKQTACLAKEECIPTQSEMIDITSSVSESSCTPGGGCC